LILLKEKLQLLRTESYDNTFTIYEQQINNKSQMWSIDFTRDKILIYTDNTTTIKFYTKKTGLYIMQQAYDIFIILININKQVV